MELSWFYAGFALGGIIVTIIDLFFEDKNDGR